MKEMKEIRYSNKMGHRGRNTYAFVVGPGDQITKFNGENIEGRVAILSQDYTKNGKWSHSIYLLQVANNVRFVSFTMGWGTGLLPEGLGLELEQRHWTGVAGFLGISVPVCQEFLRANFPDNASKLDETEAALESLAKIEDTTTTNEIVVTFGGPTNRQITDGFWTWPLVATSPDGEIVFVCPPENGWTWVKNNSPHPTGDARLVIINANHSSGYHGGTVTLWAVVPIGWTLEHRQSYQKLDESPPVGAMAWALNRGTKE